MDRVKRIWYLSHMRAAKVQASLRIRAVSQEPSLLAYTSSESRGTFRQKARSLALLIGWACAVIICHDGMLEDTNSLDGAHIMKFRTSRKLKNMMLSINVAILTLFYLIYLFIYLFIFIFFFLSDFLKHFIYFFSGRQYKLQGRHKKRVGRVSGNTDIF